MNLFDVGSDGTFSDRSGHQVLLAAQVREDKRDDYLFIGIAKGQKPLLLDPYANGNDSWEVLGQTGRFRFPGFPVSHAGGTSG